MSESYSIMDRNQNNIHSNSDSINIEVKVNKNITTLIKNVMPKIHFILNGKI